METFQQFTLGAENAVVEDASADADLVRARVEITASVERLARHGGLSLRPASLITERPLHRPSADLADKVDTRTEAGLGDDNPGRLPIIGAASGVAGLGLLVFAGATTAAVLAGGVVAVVLAIIGLVVFLAGGGWAVRTALTAARDPLRLSAPERRALAGARMWQSTQPWLGPLAQTRERRLVFVAVDIVADIIGSDAWASTYLDEHRIRLDLVTELDEIDEQAHRLAQAHAGTPDAEAVTTGWDAAVDRVAALWLYAERLRALTSELNRRAAAEQADLADDRATTLVAGAVRDELAADQVRALAEDLRRIGPAEPDQGTLPRGG
jgi:hypothetical protein